MSVDLRGNPQDFRNYPAMNEERRRLILAIWAGYRPMDTILHRMHWLDANTYNVEKVNAGLRWLVRNKLTGNAFVQFFNGECGGSDLQFYTILISKLEKEETRILTFGKDFVK